MYISGSAEHRLSHKAHFVEQLYLVRWVSGHAGLGGLKALSLIPRGDSYHLGYGPYLRGSPHRHVYNIETSLRHGASQVATVSEVAGGINHIQQNKKDSERTCLQAAFV